VSLSATGSEPFFGSHCLRRPELDPRREVGVMVTEGPVVKQMQCVFEENMKTELDKFYELIDKIKIAMMTTRRPDGHRIAGDGQPETRRRR
jgi:hypothetical protein